MLRHARYVFEASLGEEDTQGQMAPGLSFTKFVPGARTMMYYAAFRWFTDWPKGKLKAPDAWTPACENTYDEEEKDVFGNLVVLNKPFIVPDLCIGCGICQSECPVLDSPAVYITAIGESRSRERRLLLNNRTLAS